MTESRTRDWRYLKWFLKTIKQWNFIWFLHVLSILKLSKSFRKCHDSLSQDLRHIRKKSPAPEFQGVSGLESVCLNVCHFLVVSTALRNNRHVTCYCAVNKKAVKVSLVKWQPWVNAQSSYLCRIKWYCKARF